MMLTVREAGEPLPDACVLDAGALAVGIARSWVRAGRDVVVVDADAHGAGLAECIGEATRTTLSPARRGLPSLMAAREPLTARNLTRHCWRLATAVAEAGAVWLLAAPTHPDGAALSAAWLADRSGELAALASRIAVVVSMPGPPVGSYEAISRAATHQVTIAGAPGTAPPGGLLAVLSAFGFRFRPVPATLLLAADGEGSFAARGTSAGDRAVLSRFGPVRPAALLGGRVRRRDRMPLAEVDAVAGRLRDASDGRAEPPTREAGANGLVAGVGGRAAVRSEARTVQAAGARR